MRIFLNISFYTCLFKSNLILSKAEKKWCQNPPVSFYSLKKTWGKCMLKTWQLLTAWDETVYHFKEERAQLTCFWGNTKSFSSKHCEWTHGNGQNSTQQESLCNKPQVRSLACLWQIWVSCFQPLLIHFFLLGSVKYWNLRWGTLISPRYQLDYC